MNTAVTSPVKVTDQHLETLVDMAKQHGEDSEPDHEVGDLQDLLRAAWQLMSDSQRLELLKGEAADAVFEVNFEENPFTDGMTVEDKVVFSTTLQRWAVMDGSSDALPKEPTYDVLVENLDSQIYIGISPSHNTAGDAPDSPVLKLTVEINNGLPCVHVHAEADELEATIFGMAEGGISIREGDSGTIESKIADRMYLPNVEEVAAFLEREQGAGTAASPKA